MSRWKRLVGSLTRPDGLEPPVGGGSAPQIHLIQSLVFLLLVSNVVADHASSRPIVDTQYPRAQKCCPKNFLFRSPHTRARWIALFPLINPFTCDTAYLGGIAIILCTCSQQVAFSDSTLLLLG